MSSSIPGCPVCSVPLSFRVATGRKSNKPFVMIICPVDGRHFRGFISDRGYVKKAFEELRHLPACAEG